MSPDYAYIIRFENGQPVSIHCLQCDRISYNLNDVQYRYCGWCHVYHDVMHGRNYIGPQVVVMMPEEEE